MTKTDWITATARSIALFLGLIALACGGSQETSRTQVVIYSPHGKEMLGAFEEWVEARDSTLDVQWFDMGAEVCLERIRSEKANPQADIWWGAPSNTFEQGEREGLLEPYVPSWRDQIDSVYRSPSDNWYGTFVTPEVIAYNTNRLTSTSAPQDWDELLDPKWRDQIIIRSPMESGTMKTIYSAMIYRFFTEDGKPDRGYEWLLELDANTKSYAANPSLMQQKLAREEGLVTLWNLTDILLQTERYDYPFGFIVPKSGTPVLIVAIGVVKGAKHRSAAQWFFEAVTSIDGLGKQATEFYRFPIRKDFTGKPDWMEGIEITPMPINWQLLGARRAEWMQYWDQQIKGQGAN